MALPREPLTKTRNMACPVPRLSTNACRSKRNAAASAACESKWRAPSPKASAALPLSSAAAAAFGEGGRGFDSHAALVEALRKDLQQAAEPQGVRCLVKGSRGSAMDRIVSALLPNRETPSHAA